MQLVANLTLMFTEVPFLDRFAAAARAGFAGAEVQFPYEWSTEEIRRAAGDLPIVLINLPASDGRGGNGRATDAGARDAFAQGVEQAVRYAEELGVSKVNLLAGPPPIGQDDRTTARVFSDNVALAARRFERAGAELMLEVINPFDVPGFWLDSLDKFLRFYAGQGDPRIRLQFDLYHMARTEPDLVAAIRRAGELIGHVQFADNPGRHEPGTGELDFKAAFGALRAVHYDGAAAAEYRPLGRTEDGLGWMKEAPAWFGRG
ncbi:TIM barrel protein [Enterovirga aerilata]|uniref:TIM barrel protein n=1 Tax=Enterovirga aerilata TaxID=2730920 RepID=A0A849IAC9_9HYPH|nr:TIM barrel protein [Enterovirga sp. DB1703]NNM74251.1 TIM barrel protein [Enterovirga sp. DB1703]